MLQESKLPFSRILRVTDKPAYLFSWAIFLVSFWVSVDDHYHHYDTFLTIGSDSLGYYQYLPSIILEADFSPSKWAHVLENGNPLSLFSFGVAILMLPFFLIGHFFAVIMGYDTNGYSNPYAVAQFLGASFYLALSMRLLWAFLIRRFSWRITLLTLSAVYLATNLFYYSSFEPGMSHVYNFFLFACIIYFTSRLFDANDGRSLAVLGLITGLLILVKPYNLLGLLFVVFYDQFSIREKLQKVWEHKKYLFIGLGLFAFCIILQMLYWHHVADQYIVFSYGQKEERFFWGHPQLVNVLFSPQNGWLVYTPLMLFSLVGLYFMTRGKNQMGWGIAIMWVLIYYIISCWWAWWFGAAYGHRAFIEYYAFLAIPLAYFFQTIRHSPMLKKTALFAVVLFTFVNLRMSYIYTIPWDGPDWNWVSYNKVLNHVFYIEPYYK